MLTLYLPQTFSQNANRLRSVLDRNLAYWESKLVHNHVNCILYLIKCNMSERTVVCFHALCVKHLINDGSIKCANQKCCH